MGWDTDLQVGSFRGVTFPTLSITDTFARRVAQHKFPYKDGAQLEDIGAEARPISAEIVFHGTDYLADLLAFLAVANVGATGALIHPVLGAVQAKVVRTEVRHEEARRDSATVTAEFLEDGVNTSTPTLVSIDAASDALTAQTAATRTLADDLSGTAATALPATTAALDDADTFAESLDENPAELQTRLDQLGDRVNAGIAEIDELETDAAGDALDDVGRSELRDAMRAVFDDADQLKQRTERLHPKVIPQNLPVHVPLVTLALQLYNDPTRADDLLRLNKIRDPFLVPPGTVLKVFAG